MTAERMFASREERMEAGRGRRLRESRPLREESQEVEEKRPEGRGRVDPCGKRARR